MKKPLAALAAAALLLSACPAVSAAETEIPSAEDYILSSFTKAPVIDGKVTEDEWGAPLFVYEKTAAEEDRPGTLWQVDEKRPTVPASVKGYFGWDSQTLYIAMTMETPTHCNPERQKVDLWKGDSLLLNIQSPADARNYTMGFCHSTFGPKLCMAYQWNPQEGGLPNGKKNGYFYVDRNSGNTVTTYEVALPAAMLGCTRLSIGDSLPFSLALHLAGETYQEAGDPVSGCFYEWGAGLLDPDAAEGCVQLHLSGMAKTQGDFRYALSEDGTEATILQYTGDDSSVVIPDMMEEKPVTAIGEDAFNGCTAVSDIVWPATVYQIGRNAFAGTAFEDKLKAAPDGPVYVGNVLCRYNDHTGNAGNRSVIVLREDTRGIADGVFGDGYDRTVIVPQQTVYLGENNEAYWIIQQDSPAILQAENMALFHTVMDSVSNAEGNARAFFKNYNNASSSLYTALVATGETDLEMRALFGAESSLCAIFPIDEQENPVLERMGYIVLPLPKDSNSYVYQITEEGYIEEKDCWIQGNLLIIQTASFGLFAISSEPLQNYEWIMGDINRDGLVNTTDARLALQFAVGKLAFSDEERYLADVNGDNAVDTTDARLILQHAVGKI